MEMKGCSKKVDTNDLPKNEGIAHRLWKVSEELTGMKFEILSYWVVFYQPTSPTIGFGEKVSGIRNSFPHGSEGTRIQFDMPS